MKITFIYALKDPITNEVRYIGKANNPKKRFREHLRIDRSSSTHKINWIQQLLAKGLKPKLEVLEEVSDASWRERESYYISKYREVANLTNHTNGGEGLSYRGNQTSFKKGSSPWNKGIRKTKACITCGKLFPISPSGDKKYKCCSLKCSYIYRSNLTNDGSFKKGQIPWNLGKNYSITKHRNSKPVSQISIINNSLLKEYISIAEASRFTGISQANISNCVNGRSKTAGGYRWKRA